MTRTRWIIGVDVEGHSRGALHFTRWLAEVTAVPWNEAFVPVHVLDDEHLRMMLRYHHIEDAVESEGAAVARQIADVLPGVDPIPEMVREVTTVPDGLDAARVRHGAVGVIVGRAAPGGGRRVFRLGSTARRLLRRLASPVIVVPPELTWSSMGDGPVVALTSLSADSVEACRLARSIADDAGLELAIAHVVRRGWAARHEARESGSTPESAYAEPDRALARWVSDHEVWPERTAVLEGDVTTAALAFAEARGASLVALGAHPPTSARDALEPKIWRKIAAHARQPILVAPAAPSAAATRERGGERLSPDAPDAPDASGAP